MPQQVEEFTLDDFSTPEEEFNLSDFEERPKIEIKPTGYEQARLAALESGVPMQPMGAFGPEGGEFITSVASDVGEVLPKVPKAVFETVTGPHPLVRAVLGKAPVGQAFELARRGIIGGLADVGEAAIKFPGLPLDQALMATEATREPGEPPSNIQAIAQGEELPAVTQRRVLPPVLRGIETGAQELLGSAPRFAATAGMTAVGIPAPISAGVVFGQTPEGFDLKSAAIAAGLPIIGRWSGRLSDILARNLGIKSAEARAIIERLGGVGGVAAALTADQWNTIRKLPEDEQKGAWTDAIGEIASLSALGLLGAGPMQLRPLPKPADVYSMKRATVPGAPVEVVAPSARPPSGAPGAPGAPPVTPTPLAPAPVVPPRVPRAQRQITVPESTYPPEVTPPTQLALPLPKDIATWDDAVDYVRQRLADFKTVADIQRALPAFQLNRETAKRLWREARGEEPEAPPMAPMAPAPTPPPAPAAPPGAEVAPPAEAPQPSPPIPPTTVTPEQPAPQALPIYELKRLNLTAFAKWRKAIGAGLRDYQERIAATLDQNALQDFARFENELETRARQLMQQASQAAPENRDGFIQLAILAGTQRQTLREIREIAQRRLGAAPPAPPVPTTPPEGPTTSVEPQPPTAPPAAGTVTVYHGEGGVGGAGTDTSFFTRDPERARSYGPNVTAVEIPVDVFEAGRAEAKRRGLGTSSDVILPDEWVKKSKPVEAPPEKITEIPEEPTPTEAPEVLPPSEAPPPATPPGPAPTGLEHLTEDELDNLMYHGTQAERNQAGRERLRRSKSQPQTSPETIRDIVRKFAADHGDLFQEWPRNQPVLEAGLGKHPTMDIVWWDPYALAVQFDRIKRRGRNAEKWLQLALDEEVTHQKLSRVLDEKAEAEAWNELPENVRKAVQDLYQGKKDPAFLMAEYLRIANQMSRLGDSTESEIRDPKLYEASKKTILDYVAAQGGTPSKPPGVTPPATTPTTPPEITQTQTEVAAEPVSTANTMTLVDLLVAQLEKGELTKQQAIDLADSWYGGTMGEGKYTIKDLTDFIEMAVNKFVLRSGINPANANADKARADVLALKQLLTRVPTQTSRTAEMDKRQQFSTPPTHAYVIAWVANLRPGDVVLEPSSGPGGLVVFAVTPGVEVHANELSPRRADLMRQTGMAVRVTQHNAEIIHALLTPDIQSGAVKRPTVVMMNPPFSNAAFLDKKSTFVGAKHVESALALLPPGGRLVALVGEGMALNKPAFEPWWRKIANKYSVRANVGISGKEFAKYGTHFGNQIIVIDKTGPTMTWSQVVTGQVEKVEDLIPLLERIRNDRPTIEPPSAQPSGTPTPPAPPGGTRPQQPTPTPPRPSPPGVSGRPGGGAAPGRPTPQGGGGLGGVTQPPAVGPQGTGGRTPAPRRPEGPTAATGGAGGGVPPTSGVGESGLTLEQREKGELELKEHGVFTEYKPRKVLIKGAQPHSTPLVETTAMAAVEPVDPTYVPKIPQALIDAGEISDVQLEQVVYGCQEFEKFMPNGMRMGYFVGDGTGVGKTRIIIGMMLDSINRGRKKHVWFIPKKESIRDISKELKVLGYDISKIIDGNANGGRNMIGKSEGIVLMTYHSISRGNPGLEPLDPHAPPGTPRKLNASILKPKAPGETPPKSRIELLNDWLGPDFDGVIAFDESHKAGNAIDIKDARGVTKASQTGLTVVDIQNLFPKGRFLYSSATGASKVSNLSYAERLGIWGEGTPWPNKLAFFNDIQAGGLSAMEIVARDLKSLGRYLARTLSFEGVTREQLVHNLTPEQIAIYNQLSDAWQLVLRERNQTMASTGASNSGRAVGDANRLLYSAQQRFYNQLLTALQMPTVLQEMHKQLDAGNAIVLSVVNTNEAVMEREIAEKGGEAEGDENWVDDVDLSPKKILLQYVDKSYPTDLWEPYTDDNGNTRWRPVTVENPDGTRSPVKDPAALAKKQELLDRLELLNAPENPLEMILNEFGSENVTEITGRKRRIVRKKQPDGTWKSEVERRSEAIILREVIDFENDKRRILVHSGKGGTSFTFSASRKFKNQRRRVDMIIQAGWRSDECLQAMGRVHRTDQASAPHYELVSTNLKGHQRFISTINRRLAEMGALTGGERKGAGGELFDESNNLENDYAEDAVEMLFRDLHHGNVEGMDFADISGKLGFTRTVFNPTTGEFTTINTLLAKDGGLNQSKIPTIQVFLNRLLVLRFADQNNLFEEFFDRLQTRIERAKEDGTYDPGTQTLKGLNIRKLEDKVVHSHPGSTAKTRLVEIQYDQPVKITTFDELNRGKPVVKYVRNRKSGKLYALKEGPNRTTEMGNIVSTYRRVAPGTSDLIARSQIDEFLQGDDAKWDLMRYAAFEDAEAAWNEELGRTPKVRTLRDTYVVGAFLPIWDRLQIPDPKIWRITTSDTKETFLGALVPPSEVRDVRIRLGAGSGEAASAEATFNDIIVRNTKLTLANGWELKRSRVEGEPRIEVLGMSYDEGKMFVERMGGFMERRQYQPRFFIPTDPDTGIPVLDRVLKHSPPRGDEGQAPPPGGISVGPGGASPGDVPPTPPPAAGVASIPSWQRANALSPSGPGLVHIVANIGNWLTAVTRQLAGQWPVKTTMADRASGEAMARYAAARTAALHLAKAFSTQSLMGTGVDPDMLGEALVEDNLRSIREGLRQKSTEALANGNQQVAQLAAQQADAVVSLIGTQGSRFADEDAYQDFLEDAATRQAIRQHIEQWEEEIEPQFKLAMRLDPDAPLPGRGLQTGARVNLKAVFPGEEGVTVIGPGRGQGGSLTGTFRRKSPFGRRARGTGQAYEVNYHELIANTFQRQLEIARKNEMDALLVESGNAKIGRPGQTIEIAGERGIAFPLARRIIIMPDKSVVSQAQNIYVRESLAREYRTASNVDATSSVPVLTPILNVFNKAALAGLTDFTVHLANQMTALFIRPVSGGLLTDTLLSTLGRADVPVTLVRVLLKTFQDNDKQIAELAEIGAMREPHKGANPLGRILQKSDTTTRLLLDDAFQRLADAGLVPTTETARREYANAIGQYSRRMMGHLTRILREVGFGPFVVAGKTFNALGVKVVTLSPGTKATNAFAAAALRLNLLAKWIGFAVLLGVLNYLFTREKKDGGMLGRPGVPLGHLDTGLDDRNGKPLTIPLAEIFGLGRGPRVTGAKGYIQGRYLGLTHGQALDSAWRDVANSASGPVFGPGPRAAFIAATGSQPAVGVPRTAPYAAPGESQSRVNILAALKEANPLVRTFLDIQEGKEVGEAMARQFPRFAMRPSMGQEKAEKLPQIVTSVQLRNYSDSLAREARKRPLGERWKFVNDRIKHDELNPANRSRVIMQIERSGVFRYK